MKKSDCRMMHIVKYHLCKLIDDKKYILHILGIYNISACKSMFFKWYRGTQTFSLGEGKEENGPQACQTRSGQAAYQPRV